MVSFYKIAFSRVGEIPQRIEGIVWCLPLGSGDRACTPLEPSLRYQGCQRASIVGSEFCQMNPQPNEDFMPPFTLFALTHDQLSGGVSRVMPSRTSIPSNYGQVSVIDG
ncbi:hypothetical protein AB1N83_007638 [Pleurotus pulmonarius]